MNTAESSVSNPEVGLALPRVLVVGSELTPVDHTVGTVAIRFAAMLESAINLVHVLDTGVGDEPVHGEPNEAVHRALAARVRQRVEDARVVLDAERVRIAAIDRDGRAVVRVTLADGRPWEMLVQLGRELRLAWIVVGGRKGATLLGHTADHVLRHTPVPVLVVPEQSADDLAGRVVVAVDAGERAPHMLRAGAALALALGRPLEVLHVHAAADGEAPARIANRMSTVPAEAGVMRTLHLLVQKTSVAQAIAEHAKAYPMAILVVGAGGHGLVERVLGSTAASLAHISPVPVLVVR